MNARLNIAVAVVVVARVSSNTRFFFLFVASMGAILTCPTWGFNATKALEKIDRSQLPERLDAARRSLALATKTSEAEIAKLEVRIRAFASTVRGKPTATQCMHMKHLWKEYGAELGQLRETRTVDEQLAQVARLLNSSKRAISVTALKQDATSLMSSLGLSDVVKKLKRIEKKFVASSNALSEINQHSQQHMLDEEDRSAVRSELAMGALSSLDASASASEEVDEDVSHLFDLSRLGGVQKLDRELKAQASAGVLDNMYAGVDTEDEKSSDGPANRLLHRFPSAPSTEPASHGADDDDQQQPPELLLASGVGARADDDDVVPVSSLLREDDED